MERKKYTLSIAAMVLVIAVAGCKECPSGPTPEQAVAVKKMDSAPSDSIVRMGKMLLVVRHDPDGTISAATCRKYPGGMFIGLCGHYYPDEVITPEEPDYPQWKQRCQTQVMESSD